MSSSTRPPTETPSHETSTSATTTTTTTATTSEPPTSNKKKFGKNLNKLTAPPTAPPAAPGSGRKPNASSKNGLLLLSTKRISSGSNAGGASGAGGAGGSGGGGILSSKSSQIAPPRPLPNLALHTEYNPSTHDALMGVVVGASRLESMQHPDAWGVAEKQQAASVESVDAGSSPSAGEDRSSHPTEANEPVEPANLASKEKGHERDRSNRQEDHKVDSTLAEFRTSNWDEYGGRGVTDDGSSDINEDQGAYMAKLARERAEKRRGEENSRILEQKERAAQRLRELEEKMALKKDSDGWDAQNSNQTERSAITAMEKLGRSQNTSDGEQSRDTVTVKGRGSQQRTLYDPNAPSKSYSSLLGGKHESVPIFRESDTPKQVHFPASSNELMAQDGAAAPTDPQSFDTQPVIQLASYDDRDRGDRGTSNGPRMLFDPKSGAMVAVPSREDSSTVGRKTKERVKKTKAAKDKDLKKELIADTTPDSKGGRKGKNRKDDSNTLMRGKGGGVEASFIGKSDARKGKIVSPRKFPRTCGVLYSRDRKGNLSCVDGCDGDLGYGVHSVPGGRMKNSGGYATYVEDQKQMKEDGLARYDDPHYTNAFEANAAKHDHGLSLHTGFQIAETREPKHDWIKPNEKIELITGVEESPTLQATAREWAPTHSNFSVPDREKLANSSGGSMEDHDANHENQNDDVDGEDAPLGLGFDPTLNMDSVMQSPSMDPTEGLNGVDLASLSLEPALKGPAKTSHIFAFESGATWGTSNSDGGNDWGVPSVAAFASVESKAKGAIPASFLSLSSGNTWGAFGATTSLSGEHANSTGE